MNKMSLLLLVLSVCALHAADKKEEALPMEKISDIYQFDKYHDKVVAITYTSSDRVNSPFTLKDRGDLTSLKYGIISIGRGGMNIPCYSSPILYRKRKDRVDLHLFQKSDLRQPTVLFGLSVTSVELNRNLSDDIKNSLVNKLVEECKAETKEFIERENIKIRLANEEERRELWQAMFDGQVECNHLSESEALNCLQAKD